MSFADYLFSYMASLILIRQSEVGTRRIEKTVVVAGDGQSL